jgi:murein L,D-transpeptidase YafK
MPFCKKIINIVLLASLGLVLSFKSPGFKDDQLKHARVRSAYKKNWDNVKALLDSHKLEAAKLQLYIRVFKKEGILEAWAKNQEDHAFVLLTTFPVCASSGVLGPKRRQGDGQVPEGFYQIQVFQPESNFHLALKVNYPNASDLIKASAKDPGGDIMIHGNCVTIGCIPIQDDPIEQLYILCVEARNNGATIYTDIYPFKPEQKQESEMEKTADPELLRFWKSLKQGYDYFETKKKPARVTTDAKGNYIIRSN